MFRRLIQEELPARAWIVLHHASVYKNAGNFCDGRAASCDERDEAEDEAAELYKHFTAGGFAAPSTPEKALSRVLKNQ